MMDHDRDDIEESLARLVHKPASPGLRQRVLDSAIEVRKNAAMTPRMRTVAVVCSILIVAVLAIEPLVGRHEAARMTALLDGRSSARAAGEEAYDLAEVLGVQGSEADRMARLQVLAASASREDRVSDFIEARKRLKGWLKNETSEDIN
ncbi:MAG: hypothetical protein IMZ54_12745 [Acidobacteria bacterium]|nr:hypothetical protein [Acidobacteriota bacterium]